MATRTRKKPEPESRPQRSHIATFAKDKKKPGYLIRVVGQHAGEFAGETVPVSLKNGGEEDHKLTALVWSSSKPEEHDRDTGKPVALYRFEARPRTSEDKAHF